MPVLITDDVHLDIPTWVTDHTAFRRWTQAPDFPEKGNIWWLRGEVWADMSMEQLFSHNDVKGEIYLVLKGLAKRHNLGRVFADGILYTSEIVGFSGKPDLLFYTHESRKSEQVTLVEGRTDGFTEIQGTPDLVVEVVSDSSVEKDYDRLREDYFAAGIREYWLVDARESSIRFDILRRNSRGYVATRKVGAWTRSNVFGGAFRLTRAIDSSGDPAFALEVK